MGDEHDFDLLVTGNVDGLLSVVVGLVDVCPIGQQHIYHSIIAPASSLMERGEAEVLQGEGVTYGRRVGIRGVGVCVSGKKENRLETRQHPKRR